MIGCFSSVRNRLCRGDFMRAPSYKLLDENRSTGWMGSSYALGVHPNPRFYKYRWLVFWAGSPVEGQEFFKWEYALCTFAFHDFMKELKHLNEPYILYNDQIPRHEPGVTPFDLKSTRWSGVSFAPAWNNDCDPVVVDQNSILLGHR